jgi:hypothetical protein
MLLVHPESRKKRIRRPQRESPKKPKKSSIKKKTPGRLLLPLKRSKIRIRPIKKKLLIKPENLKKPKIKQLLKQQESRINWQILTKIVLNILLQENNMLSREPTRDNKKLKRTLKKLSRQKSKKLKRDLLLMIKRNKRKEQTWTSRSPKLILKSMRLKNRAEAFKAKLINTFPNSEI